MNDDRKQDSNKLTIIRSYYKLQLRSQSRNVKRKRGRKRKESEANISYKKTDKK